ncbi:MAG: hypothetical protein R3335_10400 [Anaerolineales bacterium]|nr:hypothetical protein [Anaerolineales bacterium]
MLKAIRQHPKMFRISLLAALLLLILVAAGSAGASRADGLLDGGGFPTPTPTATLIPTLSATQPIAPTATSPPVDNLIPTASTIPYPFPTFDSNLVGGSGSQSSEGSSSSPSLLVLALPFLCALSLLVGVIVYWVRNARTSA